MKLVLKDFQEEAGDRLVRWLRKASEEAGDSPQAILLSAPTGSGKTVIATAAMERVIGGDDSSPGNDKAVFLWLSDQPQLNEQSRRKILECSSLLDASHLRVIDGNFDEERLRPGVIYFLNIQKLGKDSSLISNGDQRRFTIWETIQNTLTVNRENLYLVIDEAHRGMQGASETEAKTIVQKFIKGAPGEIGAVPIIVGVSATPEHFEALIKERGERVLRPVEVKPEDVRASGLLKDSIRLYHPDSVEKAKFADTLLRSSAEALKRFSSEWKDYCAREGEPAVVPLLVVQVEDGNDEEVSATDIEKAVETIDAVIGPLGDEGYAHSFQEQKDLAFGKRRIRYIAPPDISSDGKVRVVFFKTSLNTGWDCPRAEVMMSFRRAVDATNIAQLVGRMVRTPLARRIDSHELLNTVALFLPRYDSKGLEQVINRLSKVDEAMPPVDVQIGTSVVSLRRAKGTERAFSMLSQLPIRVIPRASRASGTRRLMRLARLLANDELRASAVQDGKDAILSVIDVALSRARETPEFKALVDASGRVKVRAVAWLSSGTVGDSQEIEIELTDENLSARFEAAGRRFGEGIHKAWLKKHVGADSEESNRLKRELLAICLQTGVFDEVEEATQKLVHQWLSEYRAEIAKLPEANRQGYDDIWGMAPDVEERTSEYPHSIESKMGDSNWQRHIFVDDRGFFPGKLNGWEKKVLEEEFKRPDLLYWLRNVPRQKWSLCVDYEDGGKIKGMYPDFIVVRKVGKELTVDILDPHLLELADAPAKAKGLARYANKHRSEFGRIELIIVDGDKIRRLDLVNPKVCSLVIGVSTTEHLRQLFNGTLS